MDNTPQNQSQERKALLAKHGIRTDDKAIAQQVYTLQSIQAGMLVRIGEITDEMLAQFFPELQNYPTQEYASYLKAKKISLTIASSQKEPISGWTRLLYLCCQRVRTPEQAKKDNAPAFYKKAFIVSMRVLPILESPGQLKLEIEHREVPFPSEYQPIEAL